MSANTQSTKTALALSGGFIRVAASIGVLHEFNLHKINLAALSGSSSGALVAAAYGAGKLKELTEIILALKNFKDIFIIHPDKEAIFSNDKLKSLLLELFADLTFADLEHKIFIQASDLSAKKEIYLHSGLIREAVEAALVIPGVFMPLKQNNMVLIDGAAYELLPVSILRQNGYQPIFGVFTNLKPSLATRLLAGLRKRSSNFDKLIKQNVKLSGNMFSYIINALDQSTWQLTQRLAISHQVADLVIRPDLYKIGRFDFDKIPSMIAAGRRAARAALPFIQKKIKASDPS